MANPILGFLGSAAGQGAVNIAASFISQGMQNRANRRMWRMERDESRYAADLAYQREMDMLKYQLDYNSPMAQMQRFKDAGLNPNLIYGQGSPGNMQSAPPVPVHKAPAAPQISMMIPAIGSMLADLKLKEAQTDLIREKTDESGYKQELLQVQTEVAKNNPYLAPGYLQSVVSQMSSIARMKEQEATWNLDMTQIQAGRDTGVPMGIAKMQKQFSLLEQKYNLGNKDLKIKSEIVQSKQFLNDLQEIQRNWMRDGEITPEVIKQFLFMFLQSLMR